MESVGGVPGSKWPKGSANCSGENIANVTFGSGVVCRVSLRDLGSVM